MNISSRYVLPDDSILVPVDTLADGQRRSIEAGTGRLPVIPPDRARPLEDSRCAYGQVVQKSFASLIPSSMASSPSTGESTEDPERVLESAYETFVQLIRNNFLVEDGSPRRAPPKPASPRAITGTDSKWSGWSNCLRITEIYEACAADGFRVALKIGRNGLPKTGCGPGQEAIVLRHEGRRRAALGSSGEFSREALPGAAMVRRRQRFPRRGPVALDPR